MFTSIFLVALAFTILNGGGLNLNSLGMGGVDITIGKNSKSILLNPANTPLEKNLKMEFINSVLCDSKSFEFIRELSSNDSGKISDLMNKNIGKRLEILEDNFISIYGSNGNYSWLFGGYNTMYGRFITHTGFGSIGAMESFVERESMIVGSLSQSRERFKYGFNLRGIKRYRTIHNYTIGEIIETDTIFKYFDNRYTKSRGGVAFDLGGTYNSDIGKVGFSILDIGDTSFGEFGGVNSTSNLGLSTIYRDFLFGADYVDIFNGKLQDSFRAGVSRKLDALTLNSGVLNGGLSMGLEYDYSIFKFSLSRYKRKYQFSLSIVW